MSPTFKLDRRAVLKGAAAASVLPVASPFIIAARGESPVRIGMVDPLTGVYAAPAGNEVIGAKLAIEQMNAKGGILGRQVELLVEDSANDVGTGVQKARKLIDRDHVNAIERVFREERAAVLATLIRQVGDFQLAEDALQDAFAAAVA